MYERSAIVLERYLEKTCHIDKQRSLKSNYNNFNKILEELEIFQAIEQEEEQKIEEFDRVANEIRRIQRAQERISKNNIEMEEERKTLFIDCIDENIEATNKKLKKIEENLSLNNNELVELKNELINNLSEITEKQHDRNQVSKQKRVVESSYLKRLEDSTKEVESIDTDDIKIIKTFINSENDDEYIKEAVELMLKNGRDERIDFDENVIKKAAKARFLLAKKELECYVIAYEKMKRLLLEISNDNLRIGKYKKVDRDLSVKMAFFRAEKGYITSFLDNERLAVVNGAKVHKQLMEEACINFDSDIEQIDNLYEIILKESAGKATRKVYRELYDKTYLQNIEAKENNLKKELNKLNVGSLINSNYWRIDELKNIYEVFQKEVTEKFEKDLSEYGIYDIEEQEVNTQTKNDEDNNEENNYIFDYLSKNQIEKKETELDEVNYLSEKMTIDEDNEYNYKNRENNNLEEIKEEQNQDNFDDEFLNKDFEDDYDFDGSEDENKGENESQVEDINKKESNDEVIEDNTSEDDIEDEEYDDEVFEDEDFEDDYDEEEFDEEIESEEYEEEFVEEDDEEENEEDEDYEDYEEEDDDDYDYEEDDEEENEENEDYEDYEEDDDDDYDEEDDDEDYDEEDDERINKKAKKSSKKNKTRNKKEKKKEGKGLKGLFGGRKKN